MDSLAAGKQSEIIAKYKKAEEIEAVAGNGGQEVRDWLAAAAAMPATFRGQVLAYEPLPGCGIGVMAWTRN
jgi:2,3-dihydroxyphenylpropionate 1,2-dioxygenase